MKTLILKLAGPLQSWGTSSHFESRHTDYYPSKSAIIGLISAAFGYKRDEDEKVQKLKELSFAVRIDQPGNLIRDYHTAHKYKDNGDLDRTYVTNRYYLEDAVFIVFLSHEDNEYMEQIYEALCAPYYQPFMGRRSLPLAIDFLIGLEDKRILDCLEQIPWQAAEWFKRRNKHVTNLTTYGDANLFSDKKANLRKDGVISFNQKKREFGYRYESRTQIPLKESNSSTNHDVFGALGGK